MTRCSHEPRLRHVLVRHEQGATHAAEGYARSTGKPGVVLVTSGPGATNAVTGIVDALMDSIPLVVITGQVATHLIGTDAFQECDTIGITRPCTKHNYLVKDVDDLPRIMHEAFHIATSGRPGPVVIDIPKDVQFAKGAYQGPDEVQHAHNYAPRTKGDPAASPRPSALIARRRAADPLHRRRRDQRRPRRASALLREFAALTGAPVTSTLMGLGAFPAVGPAVAGHGRHARRLRGQPRHARLRRDGRHRRALRRPGDRPPGRLLARLARRSTSTSTPPRSARTSASTSASSATPASVLDDLIAVWKAAQPQGRQGRLADWWTQIDAWRARKGFALSASDTKLIKPQYAIERLYDLTRDRDVYITTEVGQHQMWAAQFFHFEEPNRWMTSGGLGTMGYGLPAAVGVQMAHPDSLVIDIAGDASRADDHAGDVDGGSVRPADQDLHPQQRVDGHGAPVAAAAARRALQPLLFREPAGLREAGRGLRRRRPPRRAPGRARRQDPAR